MTSGTSPEDSSRRSGRDRSLPARADDRPVEVEGWSPADQHFHLVGATLFSSLVAALMAAVVLAMASLAATPIGWILTALAGLLGAGAPYGWHVVQVRLDEIRGRRRLSVAHLPPQLAAPVVKAAEQAGRLRQLADRTPEGAVADHFRRLALTADDYVVALHDAAGRSHAASGGHYRPGQDPDLEQDMTRLAAELTELVEAADALRQTQRRLLEPSPLTELTNETENLREILEAEHDTGDEPDDRRP